MFHAWVFKKGDTYYMIGQSIWFGRDVLMFRSKHPYGPFVDQKTLFTLPEFLDKIGEQRYQHVYMVNIHPLCHVRVSWYSLQTQTVPASGIISMHREVPISIVLISTVYLIGNQYMQ